jgi:putative hemolysin
MTLFFDSPDLFIPVLVMLCLLVGSGFFSASETALFFLSEDQLKSMKTSGRSHDQRVVALLADPDRLLTAVLFWNLAINLAYFACGVVVAERLITLKHPGLAGGFGLASLSVMIVIGEVLPKSSAVLFRKSLAVIVSLPLTFFVRIFDPFAPALRATTSALRRIFWPTVTQEKYLESDDLEQAIDNSAGDKFVIRQERQVLHNILDLAEIPIEEIMRPRGSYRAACPPVRLEDFSSTELPVDYLIVLNENGEDVEGTVRLNEFSSLNRDELTEEFQPVSHVPWCATAAYVLHLLETTDCKVASVVNELGEAVGIVTYEDIVDTILAPAPSRARRLLKREPVVKVGPDEYHVDAITSLRYFCRQVGLEYQGEVDGQFTIGGLFHDTLERIPELNDVCEWRGFRLQVIETANRGNFRVMVTRQQ